MLPILAKTILAGRYLLIVFFLGLLWSLALLAAWFMGRLWSLTVGLWDSSRTEVLIEVLHLIDITLVASLIVMIALSSWDSLVDRLRGKADEQEMRWVARTDHGNLSIKMATALVGISSIYLLQAFLQVEDYTSPALQWRVAIHMVFLVGAVLLGVLDRIGGRQDRTSKNDEV